MERLTLSDYGRFKIPPPTGTKEKERPSYMDLYCRLAAIEDILGDEYDLDWLREIVEADREGKIHPKYTIGETIYDRFGEFWTVDTVELHSLYTKNEWLYRCGHDGTDDYCALWEFESFPSKEAALRREQE